MIVKFPERWTTLRKLILLQLLGSGGGTIQTVTGVSPLALANALAKPIRSLTQYGKTVQNGTPTPEAPVDIVCNNGAVKVRHRSGLPVRYQLLSFLRSSAAVDVGVKTTKNTELEAAWTRITSTSQYLYQSDSNSSGSTNTTAYITLGGNWRFGNRTASITPSQDKRYVSIQNSNGVSFNGEHVASYDTVGSFTSTNTLRVFGSGASLQVEYLKVRESGELVRDLVPVHDTVDDTYGFYDLVGGTFYTNANATFTPGDEADDPIEVVAVGTPEVLTVTDEDSNAQTASVVDLFAVGDYADTQEIVSGAVTRKCGIKILTGEESGWALSDSGTTHRFRGTKPDDCYTPSGRAPILSSHFVYVATGQGQGGAFIGASQYWYFIPTDQTIDTADKWKTWLAAQYAAGTPVIVIYPLVTETTEQTTPHELHSYAGDTTVSWTAAVDGTEKRVEYAQGETAPNTVGTAKVGTAKVA